MRALDRRFAQAPRRGNALAEPDDAGKRVDDAEAVAGRARHQQAAIIGAEIERGIGRARRDRCPSRRRAVQATADPTGSALRRPINSGVEARGVPGLAAHMSKPSCRARRASQRPAVAALFPTIAKSLTAPAAHATLVRPKAILVEAAWPALSGACPRHEPKAPGMDDRTTEAALSLTKFGIGQPVRRSEDPKLVRGEGRYTDDINLPGQAYAVMVRSRDRARRHPRHRHRRRQGDAGRARRCSPAPT